MPIIVLADARSNVQPEARNPHPTDPKVTWSNVYWVLVVLAISAMVEPTGRVCGFPPCVRIYLRSSPLVCAADFVSMAVRLVAYYFFSSSPPHPVTSFSGALSRVVHARHAGVAALPHASLAVSEPSNNPAPGQVLEPGLFFRVILFVLGMLQSVKLFAFSGVPISQAWGAMFVVYILTNKTLACLAAFGFLGRDGAAASDGLPSSPRAGSIRCERWLLAFERALGVAAVALQLGFLGWVDLIPQLNDDPPLRRWAYVGIRTSSHLLAGAIDIVAVAHTHTSDTPSASTQPTGLSPALRRTVFELLILAVFGFLVFLHQINLYYSLRYFMYSSGISLFVWFLYRRDLTRHQVLMCEPGSRHQVLNFLIFDFFCRILVFSTCWYVVHYTSDGTSKPSWIEALLG